MVQDVEVTSWDGGKVRTRDDDGTDCKGTHTAPIVVRHVSAADTQLLKGRAQGAWTQRGEGISLKGNSGKRVEKTER